MLVLFYFLFLCYERIGNNCIKVFYLVLLTCNWIVCLFPDSFPMRRQILFLRFLDVDGSVRVSPTRACCRSDCKEGFELLQSIRIHAILLLSKTQREREILRKNGSASRYTLTGNHRTHSVHIIIICVYLFLCHLSQWSCFYLN